jgi:diaminopimelate epimerase
METIKFYKYHGTGNDFVLIDNRDLKFDSTDTNLIASICHRRFGVGADGLMLLEKSENASFTMRYYNSDGRESSMCGNGGRCIAAFAVHQGVVPAGELFSFDAVDGVHKAILNGDIVNLKMVDVEGIDIFGDGMFLDTGSPHFIKFVDDPQKLDVFQEGRFWRNHERFAPGGTNVNFVGPATNKDVVMRTFERGVEDETWSCGTGAVASAIATSVRYGGGNEFMMHVPGGELTVQFETVNNRKFSNVWLNGPARFVFEGTFRKDK